MSSASESTPATASAVEINAELITGSPDMAERALTNVLAYHSPTRESHPAAATNTTSPPATQSTLPRSAKRLSRIGLLHMRSASTFADDESQPDLRSELASPRQTVASPQDSTPADAGASTTFRTRRDGDSQSTAAGRRRTDLPELERISVARLRHQGSTATLKSADVPSDPSLRTSSSPASRPSASSSTLSGGRRGGSSTPMNEQSSGPGALRQERRKRSALLEQDVSRMRSESRLGSNSRQAHYSSSSSPEHERERSFSRVSTVDRANPAGEGGYETSGTEGSGPVVGNRRRKKSSTSSASKKTAHRAAQAEREISNDGTYVHRPAGRRGSDAGARFYPATTGGRDRSDSRRAALPREFRREDAKVQTANGSRSRQIGAPTTADNRQAWPATEQPEDEPRTASSIGPPSSGYRARRFASDADAPLNDYNVSGRRSRVSVDASEFAVPSSGGRRQHMQRVSMSSVAVGTEEDGRYDDVILGSPSEAARQRKVSASSSLSHRSSGAASDLHRSTSRASLRRALGRDVFDEAAPPLPDRSPQMSKFAALSADRNTIRDRDRRSFAAAGRGHTTLDESRLRLEELGNPFSSVHDPSRSSSRASRARSNVSSTPSTSQTTTSSTSIRPPTEPRRSGIATHDRSFSEVSPEIKSNGFISGVNTLRRAQASRLAGTHQTGTPIDLNGSGGSTGSIGPRTPYSAQVQSARRSASRLGAASTQAAHSSRTPSRLAPSATSQPRSANSSDAIPLHSRNLLSSIDALDRQIAASSGQNEVVDAPNDSTLVEAMNAMTHLRDASEAAIEINTSLRLTLQKVIGYQVDAEMGSASAESPNAGQELLSEIDSRLSAAMRESDEQVRLLTGGLMALTHLRLGSMNANASTPVGSVTTSPVAAFETPPSRSRSRMTDASHSAVVQSTLTTKSPQQERVLATEVKAARRSSMDLRRARTLASSYAATDAGSRTIA